MGQTTDLAIDDVELLTGDDCVTEKKASQIDPPEESGGIMEVQSCKNRCDENQPAKESNNNDSLILSCDCFDGCFDLGTCCPDYEPICLEIGNK